jgi:beta-galactosidase
MNAAPLGLVLLTVVLVAGAVRAQDAPRLRVSVNDGWRFAYEPSGEPATPGFDDGAWERVDLPHTWNAEDAFDKGPGYRRGVGWYRKTLLLDETLRARRLFLYFEGANQVAEVFVNGRRVGHHVGGYTAFVFDVTDAVRFDAPNTVAVRVDNRHDADIPPLDADFTFYGGLYRDVWLVATNPVHIDLLDYASSGVYLATPRLADGNPTVLLRTRVTNDGAVPAEVAVVHRLLDAEGVEVARTRGGLSVQAGTVEQHTRMTVGEAPQLWSPADPYVYRVVTEIVRGDEVLDTVTNPLGFRWIEADGDGFRLNGEPLALHGTNRHQDFPSLGNALPDANHRRDVQIVKENGFNFLRLAHYPQDPAGLGATDALGLAVWEEIPIVNTITMSEAFAEHSERMLVEMIRQHYNHPSVVMWGYMNEVLLRMPDPVPEGYVAAVRVLAERLDAVAKREDPHRLTAMAFSNGEVVMDSGLQDVADVFGMNLYFGWYYDDFAALGTFLDSLHVTHPDRPLMISEYGAGTDERVHSAAPRAFDFSVEHGAAFHRASFEQIRARPWLVGSAVWNQFDFGSNHRQDTKNAINQKGLYFFDRTPKDIAYWYRAVLSDEPVLHLEREHRHRASRDPEGATQPVTVYSNAARITLRANGEAVGEAVPDGGMAVFDVPLSGGPNAIEAVGAWDDGTARSDAVTLHSDDRSDCPDGVGACVSAVNVGGTYSVTDPTGLVYETDAAAPAEGQAAGRTHHRVYGTDLDPLFQAYRTIGPDDLRSSQPLVPGDYEITFGFMESEHDAPGRRVFTVLVDGAPVIADLGLAAEAGRWTAVERTVRFTVAEPREVVIQFVPTVGDPVLSALVIRRH